MPEKRNGWGTSKREPRTPAYWRNRARCLKAAGYRCTIRIEGVCTGKATQADHILAVHLGGTDDLENLRASCAECNTYLNYKTRPKPERLSAKRPTAPHPGLKVSGNPVRTRAP